MVQLSYGHVVMSLLSCILCGRSINQEEDRPRLGGYNFIKTTYDISLDSLHLFVTKRILSSIFVFVFMYKDRRENPLGNKEMTKAGRENIHDPNLPTINLWILSPDRFLSSLYSLSIFQSFSRLVFSYLRID